MCSSELELSDKVIAESRRRRLVFLRPYVLWVDMQTCEVIRTGRNVVQFKLKLRDGGSLSKSFERPENAPIGRTWSFPIKRPLPRYGLCRAALRQHVTTGLDHWSCFEPFSHSPRRRFMVLSSNYFWSEVLCSSGRQLESP